MLISKDYYESLLARVAQLEEDNKRLTNAMFLQGGLRPPYDVPQVVLPPPAGRKSWDQRRTELENADRIIVNE